MQRLTKTAPYPLGKFRQCQLCGFESDDVCEFRMWTECDDHDQEEQGNVLVFCRKKECSAIVEKHERLYVECDWGAGRPGWFMFVCGDCKHQKNAQCTSPLAKLNGGRGMVVQFDGVKGITCGKRGCRPIPMQAVFCSGKEVAG